MATTASDNASPTAAADNPPSLLVEDGTGEFLAENGGSILLEAGPQSAPDQSSGPDA